MSLLEVTSNHGTFIVETVSPPGLKGVADTDDVIDTASASLDAVLDSITRIGNATAEKLAEMKVDQGEVTLGVKFSAKGGFFFAEVAGEATLTVKLTFKGKPS
ncbi:CU044_2847 family protein [Rhizobium leguminosarum]|jgi:hypothetical protein|uniref:CU044_2847 family protein n=1 Tax=Rhizobium leguminosarum TaxID=384 RepID=UPI0010312F02|nr:CU044_2847 family protein [Rhizobium leguminosarum]TAX33536.1 hypothetical protein ELI06_04035 [Rhizobium leguminosarum]